MQSFHLSLSQKAQTINVSIVSSLRPGKHMHVASMSLWLMVCGRVGTKSSIVLPGNGVISSIESGVVLGVLGLIPLPQELSHFFVLHVLNLELTSQPIGRPIQILLHTPGALSLMEISVPSISNVRTQVRINI